MQNCLRRQVGFCETCLGVTEKRERGAEGLKHQPQKLVLKVCNDPIDTMRRNKGIKNINTQQKDYVMNYQKTTKFYVTNVCVSLFRLNKR